LSKVVENQPKSGDNSGAQSVQSTPSAPLTTPAKKEQGMANSNNTTRSTSRWVTADPLLYWRLPHVPAVYAIVLNGRVKYIGQTTNLFKRFNNYKMRDGFGGGAFTPWGQFKGDLKVRYSGSKRFGDWAMRELRLIRRLRPEWNCVGSSRPRDGAGKYKNRRSKTTNSFVNNLPANSRVQ
jgi:hypothetical protein